jgi:hypothetical protein
VDDFLRDDNVGRDVSVLNKSNLRMVNEVWKERFKPISK